MGLNTTKAQMMLRLDGQLSGFRVPKTYLFSVKDWFSDPTSIYENIQVDFKNEKVAIRSSAVVEDGNEASMAGEFETVLNVEANDYTSLKDAIEVVIQSYSSKNFNCSENEIMVQEMIVDVALSGVLLTYELNRGAPYYVVNYDDVTGSTNTVTAGIGETSNKVLYVHRSAKKELKSERFKNLIFASRELEIFLDSDLLDIEFAIDKMDNPILLQVRGITTQKNWEPNTLIEIEPYLQNIEAFLKKSLGPKYGIFGEKTVFGQMPDWNPAEIIGRLPRALSSSLYRLLITNSAWRLARSDMGYKNPLGHPLMVSLGGQQYIDVRLSFNSFLPKDLPKVISEKLVNKWTDLLIEKPMLHDKVEFDIATTAFRFDMEQHLTKTIGNILTDEELNIYCDLIFSQTKLLVSGMSSGSINQNLKKLENLPKIELDQLTSDIGQLNYLIETCIEYGTIPFAVLARHGFIAVGLIESLVEIGFLSKEDKASFFTSVETIATEFLVQLELLQNGRLSEYEFLSNFGHLRPGTYDILSDRYDTMDFKNLSDVEIRKITKTKFLLSEEQNNKLNQYLSDIGWESMNVEKLFTYCREAISAREYSKFFFTKTVSLILEWVNNFGADFGLTKEQLSHIPIETYISIQQETKKQTNADQLRDLAVLEALRHEKASKIILPQIIYDTAGVRVVPFQTGRPNFITNMKIEGRVVVLDGRTFDIDLNNKIVVIENADPGFDWIFSKQIIGLITKFGGANSHMAIRCAEFGLPAAIGCGEKLFEEISVSKSVSLDCSIGLIVPSQQDF